ncbi:MAG: hypothetical protein J7L34_08565 [Thermotogaceae bacterium]|nr:hypothetical protein [Thermotogaceae bacterium]
MSLEDCDIDRDKYMWAQEVLKNAVSRYPEYLFDSPYELPDPADPLRPTLSQINRASEIVTRARMCMKIVGDDLEF